MVSPWLHTLSEASLWIALLCAVVITFDLMRRPQRMAVMNITWPITALYFGLIGLWAYFRFGRAPGKQSGHSGGHEQSRDIPFWQTVFIGTTHCGGGCTLGDTIAEWGVSSLGITIAGVALWPEYIADYVLAYLFGIAFQYFSIVPMRHLKPAEGIAAAIKADTLSLTAFEVGMFAWMALTFFVLFHPHLRINTPAYWFMMQIAMIVGFATSYPMNWWLIRKGIKEAM